MNVVFTPIDIASLRAELKYAVAEIQFQKLDGQLRKMRCTLMPSYLQFSESTQPHLDQDIVSQESNSKVQTVPVWDVENHGWRSFRSHRVISCQLVNSQ